MHHSRQLAALCALALGVAFLTACPPTYPKCSSDENCKDKGEVCVQGQCQECATTAHCKSGFVCEASRCVPKPECTSDSGCAAGQKCLQGKCAAAECDKDADCGFGSKCRARKCMPASACTADDDCTAGQECEAGTCVAKVAVSACRFEAIRFDFNEHNLSSTAQSQLAAIADCVKKQNLKVTLEGHADERGTEEYNLQLSNRRAASVKRYLVDLGVPPANLDTVGYGENRPASASSDETAWAANRRVEFVRH